MLASLDRERCLALDLARSCGALALSYQTGGLLATRDKPGDEGPVTATPGGFDRADRLIVTLASLVERETGPPGPDLPWLPLQRWFEQLAMSDGLPRLPEVEDCRRRLRTGEALVQVLFDPGSGRQLALWLDTRQPLRLRAARISSRRRCPGDAAC